MGKRIIRCATCKQEFAQWVSRIAYGRTYCQSCIDDCLKLPTPQPKTANFKLLPLGTVESLVQMDKEIRAYFEARK